MSQISDSLSYDHIKITDTVIIDRTEINMNDRTLKKILFPTWGNASYRSTEMNEYFTSASTDHVYWIIKEYKKNTSIEGKRLYGGQFYGQVIIKESGQIKEIRCYNTAEIWDLENNTFCFWMLTDALTEYGDWKYYRANQSLKKEKKYYADYDEKNIYMLVEKIKYDKNGNLKSTRKKTLKTISRKE